MNYFEAFILGLVQGATEFLPVSSSGHLVITQYLFGITESNLAFSIILHFGTFLAIVAAYYQTVFGLIREFFLMLWDLIRFKGANLDKSKYRRYIIWIIIATVPAGVVGVLFDDFFETVFSSIYVVTVTLFITGLILLLAEKLSQKTSGELEKLGPMRSVLVGLFQAVAIMPGISRSGTTMTGGLVAGLKKEEALEFSFLLALPTIAGSVILKLGDISATISEISIPVVAVGFVTALAVGYFSIWLFKKIVVKGSLATFSIYCFTVSFLLTVTMGRLPL